MMGVADPVQYGITHRQVGMGHVDLGPQDVRAVRKLPGLHAFEEIPVFCGRPVAVRTVPARFRGRAPVIPHFLPGQAVHVGVALVHELQCVGVQLIEVIGGEVKAIFPVESQPPDVPLDPFHEVHILRLGIGIVEPEVAQAAVLLRDPEIQADRLGVADMEVAVGLGREAGDDRAFPAAFQIGADDVADEVARDIIRRGLCRGWRIGVGHGGSGSGRAVVPEDRCQKPLRRGSGHIARLPSGQAGRSPAIEMRCMRRRWP